VILMSYPDDTCMIHGVKYYVVNLSGLLVMVLSHAVLAVCGEGSDQCSH
jgi:hypothetical protein